MDSLVTFIAKDLILVPIIAMIYLIYTTHERRQLLVLLVCGGILSFILAKIASQLYWDPRPFLGGNVKPLFTASRDNGFPSDHALLASFLAFVALRYSKKLGWALLVIALLVGWARVDAGVHHAVDIAGSFVIAALSFFIVSQLLKIKNLSRHDQADPKKS